MTFRRLHILLLAGCVIRLAHVEPHPRSVSEAARGTVRVDSTCSSPDIFSTADNPRPAHEYRGGMDGTGVVISERHVLTAAHLVTCPDSPGVTVTLYDGRRFRMVVERDEATFEGKDDGLARLVIPSASTFGLYLTPPKLGDSDSDLYRAAFRWRTITGTKRQLGANSYPGDSGTGIYGTNGLLIGILLGGDETGLNIARVDPSWLEGT